MRLEGKIAIVTGGGRGIGRGITERFLEAGARVALLQRRESDAELTGRKDVLWAELDMEDVSAFPSAVDSVIERWGGVDVLVNNAGMMTEAGLGTLTVEQWDRVMAVNVRGPAFLAQAVVPVMERRGGGSIINVGSVEGLSANPNHVAYVASKAALHGMTRAMAVDLGAVGIRVNTIAPGWIISDLSERYLGDRDDADAARAELLRMHPVGRLGRADDVGGAAVFLAGDTSAFMTGQTVVVDGGRTARLPTP